MERESVRRRARSFQAQLSQYQRAFEALVAELKRESRARGRRGGRAAGASAARDKLQLQAEVERLAGLVELQSAAAAAERARAERASGEAERRLQEARERLDELSERAMRLARDKRAVDLRCEALEEKLLSKKHAELEARERAEAEAQRRLGELRLDAPLEDHRDVGEVVSRLQGSVAELQEAIRSAYEEQRSRAEQLKDTVDSLSQINTCLKDQPALRGESYADLGVTVCRSQKTRVAPRATKAATDTLELPLAA